MSNDQNNFPEVAYIERVVAIFEVVFRPNFPVTRMKIKVRQRSANSFIAFSNLAIRNPLSGSPEWTCGIGDDIESARDDAIRYFFLEVENNTGDRELSEDDFEWSDPTVF